WINSTRTFHSSFLRTTRLPASPMRTSSGRISTSGQAPHAGQSENLDAIGSPPLVRCGDTRRRREALAKVDTVVVDKTGTVTLGVPRVTDLVASFAISCPPFPGAGVTCLARPRSRRRSAGAGRLPARLRRDDARIRHERGRPSAMQQLMQSGRAATLM